MSYDPEQVNDILRRARERKRGYADYWKWEIDRSTEEAFVSGPLLAYLEAREGWSVASHAECGNDPPDCTGTLADGRTFGVEVTEPVHEKMVEGHARRRNAERRGEPPGAKAAGPEEVAIWTEAELGQKLGQIVIGKDVPSKAGPLDIYMVAIFTDETMITLDLLERSAAGLRIATNHLNAACVLLSYHPAASQKFPNGIPVAKLRVSKAA